MALESVAFLTAHPNPLHPPVPPLFAFCRAMNSSAPGQCKGAGGRRGGLHGSSVSRHGYYMASAKILHLNNVRGLCGPLGCEHIRQLDRLGPTLLSGTGTMEI